ncbi:ABC-type polysaccharide/polyol phosphate export permease [Devosia enhydra]|uniref:ABC-type polysaccharide/polyol phosphate export permease n=1 Tax=Devosia enhydra TaxID=665118 RepID=A0A1K2HSJ3_9HYPH|nr:ABC-type polysaccharide/polyol phosphate export permease [Devosia enhydra]
MGVLSLVKSQREQNTSARNSDRWIERTLWSDLAVLYRQRKLAWSLYSAEVAEMRRTSGLGLFAPFVSVIVYTIVLGSVMALVFGERIDVFIPFFAISFPIWQAISSVVSEAAYANEKSARLLSFPNLAVSLVHLVSAYGLVINLVLKLAAASLVVAIISPAILLNANYLGAAIGVLLTSVAVIAWAVPLSFIFDRVRLLRGLLPQMLMAIYLITPILWQPERLSAHSLVYELNPVYHLVEAIRAPLLTGSIPLGSIAACAGTAFVGLLASALTFSRNRRQIIYGWIA